MAVSVLEVLSLDELDAVLQIHGERVVNVFHCVMEVLILILNLLLQEHIVGRVFLIQIMVIVSVIM